MSKYQVGETYYQGFNLLYQDDPYYYAYKCIERKETGVHVFKSMFNDQIFDETEFRVLPDTKASIDEEWEKERKQVEVGLKDQRGVLKFMVKAIEDYIKNDEFGYTFTTEERKQFPKRLKEEFGLDIDMGQEQEQ